VAEVVPELRNQLAVWTAEVEGILQQEAAAWRAALEAARRAAGAAAAAADAWAAAGGVPARGAAAVGAAAAARFEGGAPAAGGGGGGAAEAGGQGEYDCWNGGAPRPGAACSSLDELAGGGSSSSEEWEAERRRQHKARHRQRAAQALRAREEDAWRCVRELQDAVAGLRRGVEGGLAYVQRQYDKRQEQVGLARGGERGEPGRSRGARRAGRGARRGGRLVAAPAPNPAAQSPRLRSLCSLSNRPATLVRCLHPRPPHPSPQTDARYRVYGEIVWFDIFEDVAGQWTAEAERQAEGQRRELAALEAALDAVRSRLEVAP
jgi:hypothetical protein